MTSDPRGSRRIMPYCNYNKGYLVGISRLQAHSVIRVIEMVSEEPRRRTVLLVGAHRRGGARKGNARHRDIRERARACVSSGRRRTRNHAGDKVSGYCVSDRVAEPEEDR